MASKDVQESMGVPATASDRPTIDLRAAKVAKAVAEALIAAACIFWAAWWLVSPEPDSDPKYVEAWIGLRVKSRFFRTDGREGNSRQTMIFSRCNP
jgi:hypothetical protein